MPPQFTFPKLNIQEEDVVKLVLDFLETRNLHISQLSLEREAGSVNGAYSDDILFLRQLVLDGQWDDVLEFIQPLEAVGSFNSDKFRYFVLKQKYVELLCIKCEAGQTPNMDEAVDQIVKLLSELEPLTPTKEEYTHLCYLLTVPRLSEHKDYVDWNPNTGRVLCFRHLLPLVEKFLPLDKKEGLKYSKNDRLVHLLIKGLLYEACLDYCQKKAMSQKVNVEFSHLLRCENVLNDSDLSLLSWLQYLPNSAFNNPFEQITLNVSIERIHKPALEAFWTEHMLVTPIKPKMFPHTAMPYGRPRPADIMSRSLNQSLEGLPLGHGRGFEGMTKSSLPSFHLTGTGKKPMDTSVDRLFGDESLTSGQYHALPSIPEVALISPPVNSFPVNLSSPPVPPPLPPLDFSTPIKSSPPPVVRGSPAAPLLREYQTRKKEVAEMPSESPRVPSMGSLDLLSNPTASEIEQPGSDENRSLNNNSGSPSLKRRSYTSEQTLGAESIRPHQSPTTIRSNTSNPSSESGRPKFISVNSLEDAQAIRCAEFHPAGKFYAVGSNSKTLRVCSYPDLADLREDHITRPPTVLFKRTKHHKGSIYCLGWNPAGDLIATGSNDKTVKLMRFSSEDCSMEGPEVELTMHDGTIRDVCFVEDSMNKSSLLISGGAGDCKVYVTDCSTGTPFQALSGHTAAILSLYTWGGAMFASGSQDKTVRFWDLRTGGCVSLITPVTNNSSVNKGSPVASTCVDPSGRLLVTGHEDGACVFYDIRGSRHVQMCKPHASDVRSVRFSPSAYYLLTAGYDGKLILTDLQGDLTRPLPSVSVAQHGDKSISARWHPSDFSFISTSADKTCALWALPPV